MSEVAVGNTDKTRAMLDAYTTVYMTNGADRVVYLAQVEQPSRWAPSDQKMFEEWCEE